MNVTFLVILIVAAVLLTGSVVALFHMFSVNVLNPEGKGAAKKTTRILKKFGLIRGFKVLSDLHLEFEGKSAYIENMLVGYFGILLVSTCGARGEYYGTLESERWTVTRKEGREKSVLANPVLEQKKAVTLLRSLFAKNGIYKVGIDTVVYMTSRASKTAVYITHGDEILKPGKLSGFLGRTKFESDAGHDVARIAELISRHVAAE